MGKKEKKDNSSNNEQNSNTRSKKKNDIERKLTNLNFLAFEVLILVLIIIGSLMFILPLLLDSKKSQTSVSSEVGDYIEFGTFDNAQTPKSLMIEVDDYIEFGTYYNDRILWKVMQLSNDEILLWSEYILTAKCYDASESGNVTDKEIYTPDTLGSNVWSNSNIRQWLNTTGYVEWKTQAPTKKAINGENNYQNEAGFLSGFSQPELVRILQTTRTITNDKGKIMETTKDLVFLASLEEVKSGGQWKLDINDRFKLPTKQAVSNDMNNYMSEGISCWYWLMTPVNKSRTDIIDVYGQSSQGHFTRRNANFSKEGVAPAITIVMGIPLSGAGTKINPWKF